MNNEWQVYHLPHADPDLLAEVCTIMHAKLNPELSTADLTKYTVRIARSYSNYALVCEAEEKLKLLRLRRLTCFNLPEVPWVPLRVPIRLRRHA